MSDENNSTQNEEPKTPEAEVEEALYSPETETKDETEKPSESENKEQENPEEAPKEEPKDDEEPKDEKKVVTPKPKEEPKDEKEAKAEEEETAPVEIDLPEGIDPDSPLVDKAFTMLNGHFSKSEGVDPEALTKDIFALFNEANEAREKADSELWIKTAEEWQAALKKEHGEEGLKKLVAGTKKLFVAYQDASNSRNPNKIDKELATKVENAFHMTGAGNNPAILNFLFWVDSLLGEGAPISGASSSEGPEDLNKMIYEQDAQAA